LNLNDAIPLCMYNKFYSKVLSIHNNCWEQRYNFAVIFVDIYYIGCEVWRSFLPIKIGPVAGSFERGNKYSNSGKTGSLLKVRECCFFQL